MLHKPDEALDHLKKARKILLDEKDNNFGGREEYSIALSNMNWILTNIDTAIMWRQTGAKKDAV